MTDNQHAIANARSWLESIREMIARLESDDDDAQEAAREEIQQSALSVQVRGGWRSLGEESTDDEYEILLTTGGPALRIVGDLDRGDVTSAALEWQDWGTPWTGLQLDGDEPDAVEAFARCFYFGEG